MTEEMIKIDGARKVGANICAYVIATGERYALNHKFSHRDAPELHSTLRAVRDRGIINLKHWHVASKWER